MKGLKAVLIFLLMGSTTFAFGDSPRFKTHALQSGDSWESLAVRYDCPGGRSGGPAFLLCAFNAALGHPFLKSTEADCGTSGLGTVTPRIPPNATFPLWIPPQCAGAAEDRRPFGEPSASPPAQKQGSTPCKNCNWTADDFAKNDGVLRKAMEERGFKPPPKFRAVVVKTMLGEHNGVRGITAHELYDYNGLATDYKNWNPASTVKIFSAVAAIARIKEWGFSVGLPDSLDVTFHEAEQDRTFNLEFLLEKAAHISKNHPHNRLMLLAGFDFMNGENGFLRKRAGLDFTYIIRGYELKNWRAQGNRSSLRDSPRITLRGKGIDGRPKVAEIPAREGHEVPPCQGTVCTSLSDLSKFLCTLLLHEMLPRTERFTELDHPECELKENEYCPRQSTYMKFIRTFLNRKRKGKKDPVWDIFAETFGVEELNREENDSEDTQLFRKSGWSRNWASDVLFLQLPQDRPNERWIVAMACHGNRYCLGKGEKSAAQVIADIIVSNGLQ